MGVKVRQKRSYLYLDIVYEGRRRLEALGLSVPRNASERREMMALAESIHHKREFQLAARRFRLLDPCYFKDDTCRICRENRDEL